MRTVARIGAGGLLVSLCVGCAPHPLPMALEVGASHEPYRARPRYLASRGSDLVVPRAPVGSDNIPVAGPRPLPMGERLDRVRAILAAVDAHIVALDERSPATLSALSLSLDELHDLLAPYTDLSAEVDELTELSANVPSLPPARLPAARQRLGQLTDLIRLQIEAGR